MKCSGQCEGCAFLKGAAAFNEPYNWLKSTICAATGIPFFCHRRMDWENSHLVLVKGRIIAASGSLPEKLQICAGWKEYVSRYKERGQFADPEIRKLLRMAGERALVVLDSFLNEKQDDSKKQEHLAELQSLCGLIFAKPEKEVAA